MKKQECAPASEESFMPDLPVHFVFFPGMIFHELSHWIACLLLGVRVSKVKLFGSSEAFVEHAKPNAWQSVLITIAPFVLCNVLAFQFFLYGLDFASTMNLFAIVFLWFAFSLAIFSFPSKHDALNAFGSFLDFYKKNIFGRASITSKLFWIIAFPFLFIPLVLLLGTMAAFDYSVILRFAWAIVVFAFAFDVPLLNSVLSAIASAGMQIISSL